LVKLNLMLRWHRSLFVLNTIFIVDTVKITFLFQDGPRSKEWGRKKESHGTKTLSSLKWYSILDSHIIPIKHQKHLAAPSITPLNPKGTKPPVPHFFKLAHV
jgi:hypothetical protein